MLLALASAQMLAVVARKSITVDEIVMIPAAYYHLAAGDFQFIHEHPPLAKIVAAVPLLFVQPDEPRPDQISAPPGTTQAKWDYTAYFWEDNYALFDSISFWSRVPMIALTAALGVLIFLTARETFGPRAAVLAVALFSLEPTVLAHGRVVQTDIPAAFGYLLFFVALRHYSAERTARRALWLGAAAAVAILSKFSMLLAGPVLAAYFAYLLWRARRQKQMRATVFKHAALVTLAALVVVNAAYFFRHRSLTDTDAEWIQKSFPSGAGALTTMTSALAHVIPADFILGILFQIWHNGQGHNAGFLGMYGDKGWWYYFPVAFALKTTIPFLLLSLASLAWGARECWRRRDARFAWLLAPFAVYTVFVLFSNIDIGVRYYLPAYTFLFILAGALLERLLGSRRVRRAGALAAVALLCWVAVEAARAQVLGERAHVVAPLDVRVRQVPPVRRARRELIHVAHVVGVGAHGLDRDPAEDGRDDRRRECRAPPATAQHVVEHRARHDEEERVRGEVVAHADVNRAHQEQPREERERQKEHEQTSLARSTQPENRPHD